jgi:hypothetical protein
MALFVLVALLCVLSSLLIARAVYKINVKNKYKYPWVGAVVVFVFTLAIFLFGIYLLLNVMFQR